MNMSVFVFWNYAFILAILLLYLREDRREIFIDILSMFVTTSIIGLLVSSITLYLFIPLTIPYSIKKIINKK